MVSTMKKSLAAYCVIDHAQLDDTRTSMDRTDFRSVDAGDCIKVVSEDVWK